MAAINGSGTPEYVPVFTTSTDIGDSQIYDNGSFVGIGYIADPSSGNKFAVNGNSYFGGTLQIGTTAFPGWPLVVQGDIFNVTAGGKRWSTAPLSDHWRFSSDVIEIMQLSDSGVRISTNVGAAANKLVVDGNMSIGNAYNATTAPANGLIVEGNVLVGSSTPTTGAPKLDVTGSIGSTALSASSVVFTDANKVLTSTGVVPAANGGAGTVSGLLKANGSGTVSAAVANTDYLPVTSPVMTTPTLGIAGATTLTLTSAAPTPSFGIGIGTGGATNTFSFQGVNGFRAIFASNSLTASRSFSLPNAGGFIMTNPLTTAGDISYLSANSSTGTNVARLGIGSTGQVLTVVSGLPAWVTPSGISGTSTYIPVFTGATTIGNSPFTISSYGIYPDNNSNQLVLSGNTVAGGTLLNLNGKTGTNASTATIRFGDDSRTVANMQAQTGGVNFEIAAYSSDFTGTNHIRRYMTVGIDGNIYMGNDDGAVTHATEKLQVLGNILVNGEYRLVALNTAPANSSDAGITGEIRFTSGYIYLCIATNTWVRAAFSSF